MGDTYVDRGDLVRGINKAVRDSRVPYNLARAIENFSLPDGRAKRRTGYAEVNAARVLSQQITKATGATVEPRHAPSANSRQTTYKTPLSYGVLRDGQVPRLSTVSDWTVEFYATLGDLEDLVVRPFERRAKGPNGPGATYAYDLALRTPGVYLLDCTILSNRHEFDSTGTIAAPGTVILLSADHGPAVPDGFWDVFPLTAMAISYTQTHIQLEMGMVAAATHATPGLYWPREINLSWAFPGGSYTPGDSYHIAVTYKVTAGTPNTGVVTLYVDGTARATYNVADAGQYDFIGGSLDIINDVTYAPALQRDWVLLNECTARGSYASACRMIQSMHAHQTFFHDYSTNTDDPSMPWACSPPRGTKIRDLRFWDDERTQSEIDANKTTSFDAAATALEANLVGNWLMNNGQSILYDLVDNQIITLHHGYSPYVVHNDLLHNLGVHISDGQHLRLSCKENDEFFIKDLAGKIKNVFGVDYHDSSVDGDHQKIQDRHQFTAQIEITTPKKFQEELNAVSTGAPQGVKTLADATGAESRQSLEGGGASAIGNIYMGYVALRSGEQTAQQGVEIADETGSNKTTGNDWEYNRAYDQTLFCVEGSSETVDGNNHGDYIKQVLARGSITPAGKVAFELYLNMDDLNTGLGGGVALNRDRLIRVVSTTTLSADTTYVITFVKKTTYDPGTRHPTGIQMEIWIGTASTPPTAADVTYNRWIAAIDIAASGGTFTPANPTVYNAGANHPAYIKTGEQFMVEFQGVTGTNANVPLLNDHHTATWVSANQFSVPIDTSAGGTVLATGTVIYESTLRTAAARHGTNHDILIGCSEVNSGWDRSVTEPNDPNGSAPPVWHEGTANHGPYFVTKQYPTPYQQQPGFFTLGYFRLWGQPLSKAEIQNTHAVSISNKDDTPNLLINLEIEDISGNRIPNKSRYPVVMEMGYMAWGAPQSWEDQQYENEAGPIAQMREVAVTGGFAFEDCIGFSALHEPYNTIEGGLPSCLAPYQTTLTYAYGLIYGWRDHLNLDIGLDGTFQDLFITAHGILNDFAAGGTWRGVPVGDRTILTSDGGIPKVYNGKHMTPAGLKAYSGGRPLVRIENIAASSIPQPFYFGVRIAYRSEEYNLLQFSDVAVVKTTTSGDAIEIYDISPHPDPRITSIVIYRTRAQANADLARVAPMFPVNDVIYPNANVPLTQLVNDDDELLPAPLDLRQDPFPICRYGALANGRLYVAGDSIIPDAVYYSDVNNPEKFDLINQRVLLRDTGSDRINGIVSLFGSIFVFKSGSIWRIDEFSGGVHQRVKVADIGAVSENGIQVITIPDTGRTVIFVWSQHGPYLFDGSVTQYIGYQLESFGDPATVPETLTEVDPGTVVVSHDLQNKEILCVFLSEGGTSRKFAQVYNYRFGSWYTYFGLSCDLALSMLFSGNTLKNVSAGTPQVGTVDLTHEFLALHAGPAGKIYKWGESKLDGFPQVDVEDNPYTVAAFSPHPTIPTIFQVTVTPGATTVAFTDHAYVGLYLTLVDVSDSNVTFFSSRIVDNVANVFDIVATNQSHDHGLFVPVVGDIVYVCQAAAHIVFPWDSMDREYVEKLIEDLITWHSGLFYYALWKNWKNTEPAIVPPYNNRIQAGALAVGDNSRKEKHLQKSVESLKLELHSFDLDAQLNAFTYRITVLEDGIDN